jgi:hypothetical protein
MVKKTPEGLAKAAILDYLQARGFFAWNNATGCVRVGPDRWLSFGKKGSADILGCLPGGRFLAIEVKAPYGRLSTEQKDFLEKIRGLGGMAMVAHTFQELDTTLRREGYTDDGPLFSSENMENDKL